MESLVHGILSNAAAVTVLAVVLALAGRLCRRPALIHSVCLLAMLKLVTPPVVSLPVPGVASWSADSPAPVLPDPDDPPLAPVGSGAEPAEATTLVDELDGDWLAGELVLEDLPEVAAAPASWSWEAVALGLVLSGALAWWAVAAVRIVRFHRLIRDVESMPAEWHSEAAALAARLGLRRPPSAYLVPGDLPPMLWAFGLRVRLLVPSRLWLTLGDDERTALLLHELAHLKRRDHWVRWLELVIAGLYWWHPAVWWIRRALREAEEQCCDAWVVSAMPHGGAKTYAAALVAALEFLSGARTAPPAAASATIGNGHVSSLKRRLRMIVRAKTPKGLSWAGRLAVAGLSALLLPLAPSWARKDATPVSLAELDREIRSIDKRITTDLEAIEVQAARDVARDRPGAGQTGAEDPLRRRATLRRNLEQEFGELNGLAQKTVDELTELVKRGHVGLSGGPIEQGADSDQLRASRLSQDLASLRHRQESVKQQLARLDFEDAQDDGKDAKPDEKADEPKKGARGREATGRIEQELKELKEKLGKDLDPVTDAVRKSLDRALEEIQQTLKKEGMTAEDLRRAVDKSRRDLQEALRRGGPVEKEVRGAAERARKDMQDAMERQMREAMRGREELKGRMEESREQQQKAAEAMRDQMRKRMEQQRQANQERQALARREAERLRELARARVRRQQEEKKESREKAERPKVEEKRAPDEREKADRGGPGREELDAARQEIRELQQRLREANSRLERLQRRETRRPLPLARPATPAPPARPAEPRRPEEPARPAEPRRPEAPARPATPAAPTRPTEPRRVTPPARATEPRGTRERDDYDRRFRDLEQKLDRLLRELEEIKGRPTSGIRTSLSR
jgi:beta-lactamase regulating signal transducer with metallopeptidase domain